MRPDRHLLLTACGLLLCACVEGAPPPPQVMDPPTTPVARSVRGNLRFKGPERLNADLAAALELKQDEVCAELGLYQCASFVHNVALGGVDPYGAGLYERSGATAVTTPLVVERIAWAACTRRVEADLENPAAAVVFRGVPLQGGKLANPGGDEVRAAIGQLTQRALQRDPYTIEIDRYVQLARDIEALGQADPGRAWMQAACFAVLSSAEAVFY